LAGGLPGGYIGGHRARGDSFFLPFRVWGKKKNGGPGKGGGFFRSKGGGKPFGGVRQKGAVGDIIFPPPLFPGEKKKTVSPFPQFFFEGFCVGKNRGQSEFKFPTGGRVKFLYQTLRKNQGPGGGP